MNGARPVLSGIAQPGGAVLRVLGSHYVIEGLDVTAGGNAQTARGFYNVADDITLRDSVVHDCPHMGIAGADASGVADAGTRRGVSIAATACMRTRFMLAPAWQSIRTPFFGCKVATSTTGWEAIT